VKIVISHDVDHLSVREHLLKDFVVQRYIIWSLLEFAKRKINLRTLFLKLSTLFKKDSWNNLRNLLEFDKKYGVPSTFFVAVRNGKGLSYSLEQAFEAIRLIRSYGFEVGVHGIAYDDFATMKYEHDIFKKLTGINSFGIRMHYLRVASNTLSNLSRIGYLFDTSILSIDLAQHYKVNGMWEFPFHIMDGNLLGPRTSYTLDMAKRLTMDILERAGRENITYVGILFHQRYFGRDFPHYREWYLWLI
jgi:peptidoglycan/xylan/chitin deacetylase (PgdA/CDA1 family)